MSKAKISNEDHDHLIETTISSINTKDPTILRGQIKNGELIVPIEWKDDDDDEEEEDEDEDLIGVVKQRLKEPDSIAIRLEDI